MKTFTLILRYKNGTDRYFHDVTNTKFISSEEHNTADLRVYFKNGDVKMIRLFPLKSKNYIYRLDRRLDGEDKTDSNYYMFYVWKTHGDGNDRNILKIVPRQD